MATSTFFTNIVISDKAADILIKGLEGPKPPRPAEDFVEIEKKSKAWLEQFRANINK
jgi:hypothetical protein